MDSIKFSMRFSYIFCCAYICIKHDILNFETKAIVQRNLVSKQSVTLTIVGFPGNLGVNDVFLKCTFYINFEDKTFQLVKSSVINKEIDKVIK